MSRELTVAQLAPSLMTEDLQRRLRVIHDLERAIRLWELLRENAQRVVDETIACSEKQEHSIVETNPTVTKARSHIDACNASILAAKERIDDLARGD
jgi:hypothetical protein